MALSINDSLYSCLFFFLTGLHFFHLTIGLLLLSLFFWSCSFSYRKSGRQLQKKDKKKIKTNSGERNVDVVTHCHHINRYCKIYYGDSVRHPIYISFSLLEIFSPQMQWKEMAFWLLFCSWTKNSNRHFLHHCWGERRYQLSETSGGEPTVGPKVRVKDPTVGSYRRCWRFTSGILSHLPPNLGNHLPQDINFSIHLLVY